MSYLYFIIIIIIIIRRRRRRREEKKKGKERKEGKKRKGIRGSRLALQSSLAQSLRQSYHMLLVFLRIDSLPLLL